MLGLCFMPRIASAPRLRQSICCHFLHVYIYALNKYNTKKMNNATSHVIGNGASQRFYKPQDGFVVVCNLNWQIPHDVVSIIDPQPINYMLTNQITTDKTVWCSPKAQRLIRQHQLPISYDCVHNQTVRYNNAQCVVLHLLKHGATTIHLYGCDTLWSEDMTSTQDDIIPRPNRDVTLWIAWRKLWQQIFAVNLQVDYMIHSPVRVATANYGANVRWHQHMTL